MPTHNAKFQQCGRLPRTLVTEEARSEGIAARTIHNSSVYMRAELGRDGFRNGVQNSRRC